MSSADSPHEQRPAAALAAHITAAALRTVVETLEEHPELAARLRGLLAPAPLAAPVLPPFMSMRAYARHAGIGVRTVQQHRAEMTEGVHYHRDGRAGRRVIMHVAEADAWRAARRPRAAARTTIDQLAADEVSRRRARARTRVGAQKG